MLLKISLTFALRHLTFIPEFIHAYNVCKFAFRIHSETFVYSIFSPDHSVNPSCSVCGLVPYEGDVFPLLWDSLQCWQSFNSFLSGISQHWQNWSMSRFIFLKLCLMRYDWNILCLYILILYIIYIKICVCDMMRKRGCCGAL